MSAKSMLLNWLAEDNLPNVFQGLFSLADKYKDEQLRNYTILQSGHFKELEKQSINGTITLSDLYLYKAKIRESLLQIIHKLPNDWLQEEMLENKEKITPPFDPQSPNLTVTTKGDKSPVVITKGDVNISFGEDHPSKNSTK